jgi:hypothetical protein
MLSVRALASALSLIALSSIPASAAVITFSGEDIMTTIADPHPISALAASNFIAATPGASLINFESAPLGSFTSLLIAPGVTLTGTGTSINNVPNFPSAPTLDGYNTTPSGAQYAELLGNILTFHFTTPVQAFGAYFTGLQSFYFQDTVSFNDGTSQVINMPETGTGAGVGSLDFVGFTDFGASITSVSITSGNGSGDFIGVDDARFLAVPSTTVPEPITLSMFGAGIAGVAALRRRKKAKQA